MLILIAPTILSGYTFPDDAPYIEVNTSELGHITIYFADNMVQYLHVDETSGLVISSYSNSLYGYTNNDVRINWTAYTLPVYNTSGSYQSVTLHITEIIENHLVDYNSRAVVNHNYEVITLALIGGVILLLFFKK